MATRRDCIHWTPEMERTLREMRAGAAGAGRIGDALGISHGAVERKIKLLALPPLRAVVSEDAKALIRELWPTPISAREIAAKAGMSLTMVYVFASEMGLPRRGPVKAVDRGVPSERAMAKLPIMERRCLDCRQLFNGDRITFVCKNCKQSADWTNGPGIDASLSGVRMTSRG